MHLRHLYFPESKDIDLFRFELAATPGRPDADGRLTVETMAERQLQSSLLDTSSRCGRLSRTAATNCSRGTTTTSAATRTWTWTSAPGVYYVGVSASGNDEYDPIIEDSGFGGTTQGEYELRLNYRPERRRRSPMPTIRTCPDLPGRRRRRGSRRALQLLVPHPDAAETLFVDKSAANGGTGTITAPYNNLKTALTAAQPGQIVRVVGTPGLDGKIETVADNQSYQIGFNSLGAALPDGSTLEIPRGVTVMVDAGAVFQMRRARSAWAAVRPASTAAAERCRSGRTDPADGQQRQRQLRHQRRAVQNTNGTRAAGSVYFTSYNDQTVGLDTNPFVTTPANGDWGGIEFRSDIDRTQGYFQWADEGIFLNYVNHADIRYGGGNVLINSVSRTINPIHITDARPTVTYNTISRSADASMSASSGQF